MKPRLLEWLCCPQCQGVLTLEAFDGNRERHIEEGALHCGTCARQFPIIGGIPRMLPDPLAEAVVRFHPAFFQRYACEMVPYLASCRVDGQGPRRWWRAERRTVTSYSYQWRKFKQMRPQWERVFLDSIRPVEPAFFARKVGLDAGCGFGRSLYYAASYGAEVIGVDLSEAVEAARENTRGLSNVHLIQADLYQLPLKPHILDFVYSIGVLHHLPDPKQGFLALTKLLKPDAPIFIWVYARGKGRQIPFLTAMRAVSTRLPLRLLNAVCLLLAVGHWSLWIAPYRLLNRFAATRGLAQRLPFTLYAKQGFPFRVLYTDWFDGLSVPLVHYHRREEVQAWFREAGFAEILIEPAWGGRALGRARRTLEVEVAA